MQNFVLFALFIIKDFCLSDNVPSQDWNVPIYFYLKMPVPSQECDKLSLSSFVGASLFWCTWLIRTGILPEILLFQCTMLKYPHFWIYDAPFFQPTCAALGLNPYLSQRLALWEPSNLLQVHLQKDLSWTLRRVSFWKS